MALTLEKVKEELGIDGNDSFTNNRLNRYIQLADKYLVGAVGENYPKDDERAIQIALLIIEDLYDRKSYNVKENSSISKLKNSLLMQLKWGENNDNLQQSNQDSET